MPATDLYKPEEVSALSNILQSGIPTAVLEGKTPINEELRRDAVPLAPTMAAAPPKSEGLVRQWMEDEIALAIADVSGPMSPANGDAYAKIEDAVWQAALSGTLGDGKPSEVTRAAVRDLISQLVGDLIPQRLSDTDMEVQQITGAEDIPVQVLDQPNVVLPTASTQPAANAIAPLPHYTDAKDSGNLMARLAEREAKGDAASAPAQPAPSFIPLLEGGKLKVTTGATDVLKATEEPALDTPKAMMDRLNPYQTMALSVLAKKAGSGWKAALAAAWESGSYNDLDVDDLTVDCLMQIGTLTDKKTTGLRAEKLPDDETAIPDDGRQSTTFLQASERRSPRKTPIRTESRRTASRRKPAAQNRGSERSVVETILDEGFEATVQAELDRG